MRIEQDLTELVEFLIQGPERPTHQFHVVFREILFLSSPEFGPRKRTISALEPQSPNASFLSKPSVQISSKNRGKLPTRLLMTYPSQPQATVPEDWDNIPSKQRDERPMRPTED